VNKILVIEDDLDMTFILNMALANKYIVKIINDTQHILEILDQLVPDVILTDNFIGQKKACEIIKEIRDLERYKMIPVILFTGHPDIKKLSREINASAYLSKPFNLVDLYSCIDEVLFKIFDKKVLLSL
jgi:DNA-binding NtrC family response regulator